MNKPSSLAADRSYPRALQTGGRVHRFMCVGCTLVTTLILVSACAHRVPGPPLSPPSGENARSCVALSGGGIRSGAVSLGVLQELHANGTLRNVRYLSTVSGGGYPVYGLLHRMISDGASLDELLAEGGQHVRHADRNSAILDRRELPLAGVAALLLWTPLSLFNHRYGSAQPTYAAKIHRTFGGGTMPLWGGPKLRQAAIVAHALPIPIFGASASVGGVMPRDGHKYSARDYFEIAPDVSGALGYGFYSGLATVLSLSEAVAISGAAIDVPTGAFQIPGWAKDLNFGLGTRVSLETNTGNRRDVYLTDGGFIDNLGLLPLLRRGCADVLIFDNSHYSVAPFDSWHETVAHAESLGWRVVDPLTTEDGAGASDVLDGWRLPGHIWHAAFQKDAAIVRIRLARLGVREGPLSLYPEHVAAFADSAWGGKRPMCEKEGFSRRCSFPLQVTQHQAFTSTEFRAYRLLGRCLAAAMSSDVTATPPCR